LDIHSPFNLMVDGKEAENMFVHVHRFDKHTGRDEIYSRFYRSTILVDFSTSKYSVYVVDFRGQIVGFIRVFSTAKNRVLKSFSTIELL